jgi:aspartyl aminopeptidase
VTKLNVNGFEGLSADEPLTGKLQAGGKYYYTVEHSTIVAFTVGKNYQPGRAAGFHMIGAHVDSPTLKLKPRSKLAGSGRFPDFGIRQSYPASPTTIISYLFLLLHDFRMYTFGR